jgi:hypothetical protein
MTLVAATASEAIRTSRSARRGWMGESCSWSARSMCCPADTKRVLVVVARPPCTKSQGSTPGWPPIRPVRSLPAWSSPTTDTKATAAPSAVRFRTTLPAPPGSATSRSTASTGTGASGLTRETRP